MQVPVRGQVFCVVLFDREIAGPVRDSNRARIVALSQNSERFHI